MAGNVTYRGVSLFIDNNPIHRASSFGSSFTRGIEEVYELGNKDSVGVVEGDNSTDITLDIYDHGSIDMLRYLARKSTGDISFQDDFDNKAVDLWATVEPSDAPGTYFTQVLGNVFLNSVRYSYTVDGNFTESYSLACDNKYWVKNNKVVQEDVNVVTNGKLSLVATPNAVFAVKLNDKPLVKDVDWTWESGTTIECDSAVVGDTAIVTYCVTGTPTLFTPNTEKPAALRRAHAVVYLVKDRELATGTGRISNAATNKERLRLAQNINIDVTLNRDETKELGAQAIVGRYLQYPINVTVSFDVTGNFFDVYQVFNGGENPNIIDLSLFKCDSVGLLIEVFKDKDQKEEHKLKTIEIPTLVPTDESMPVSIDSRATQSMSFRSHNAFVY